MAFNVQAARQAGYTDPEIAAYLATDQGFDLDGARAAGYADPEIIAELAPAVSMPMGQRINEKLFGSDGRNGTYATGVLTSLKETLTGAGRPPSTVPWSEIPGEAFDAVKRTLAKTVAGARLQFQEQAREAWAQPGVWEAMPMQARNALQNMDAQETIERERQILAEIQADEQALAARNPSFAQETAIGAAGSVAAAGPALAVGFATKNPGAAAATIFGTSQPLGYAESRMQGIPVNQAQRAAYIKAAIEVGTEYFPARELFKAGTPGFKRLVNFMAAEIPGESLATLGQTMTDYLSALPDDVTGQDVIDGLSAGVEQLPQTAATAVVAGGAQVGAIDVLNRASAGIEARLRAREERRQQLRPPRVETPPVIDEPPPPDLPPLPPEAPPAPPTEAPPVEPPQGPPEVPPEAPVPPTEAPPVDGPATYPPVPPGETLPPHLRDLVGPGATVTDVTPPGYGPAGETPPSAPPADPPSVAPPVLPEPPVAPPAAPPVDEPFAPEVSDADKWQAIRQRIATDEQLRADLVDLASRAGWAVKGGRLITRGDFETTIGGGPEVVGRTAWEPRESWWLDRPPGLQEKALKAAVEAALAGRKLGPKQEEAIRFLVVVADERAGRYDDIVPPEAHVTAEDFAGTENPATQDITRLAQMASQFVDEDTIAEALEAQTDAEAILRLEAILKEHGYGNRSAEAATVGAEREQSGLGEAQGERAVSAQRAGGDLFGGGDRTALNEKNARVDRKLGKGQGPVDPGNAPPGDIFRADRDRQAREAGVPVEQTDVTDDGIQAARVQKAAAGAAYVGMYQSAGAPTASASTISLGTTATGTARQVKQDAEPVRREHIMALFQRELGLKIYQGKPFRVRGALGYFRPTNFEVRNKNLNDLEVAAHEVFHWIDRTYPSIRSLYHQRRFGAQLKSISYDASKLDEGFAEFGRLFMTKESEAVAKAPDFYTAFVAEAKATGLYGKLARVQEQMHKWYLQGADARAKSKIGEVRPPISQEIAQLLDGWGDRAIAASLDYLQAAKVIEREIQGGLDTDAAFSPYKSLRLLAGARSVANTFLNHGTLEIGQDGAFQFSGPGLRQIFEPVADVMDDTMAYFVGRRANELRRYGKERLFAPDEIEALLARGTSSPKAKAIRKAFDDYQGYTHRLMDFAVQCGIVSRSTVSLWREMYQNYVPFYRVAESLGGAAVTGNNPEIKKAAAIFKRLRGGTGNLRDTWENLTFNTAHVVHAGLKNLAKRQLFAMIGASPLGQKYAVKIPTDTHAVPIGMQQVEGVLRKMVDEAKVRALDPQASPQDKAHYLQVSAALDFLTNTRSQNGGALLDAIQSQATFFTHGHPPGALDKDSVLVNGERVWFQIGDPLLWGMLEQLNVFRPLGVAERALGLAKRVLTRGVTLTPEFQIANLIRDGYNAFTVSKYGQLPIIDSLRSFRDIWTQSEAYRLFLANGGGFGNAISDEAKRVQLSLHRLDRNHLLDAPAKLVDFWDTWGQSFELATRLAEFKRGIKAGATAREAAFQGREVSSDFAMHGSAQLTRLAIASLPFFGARLQGLYKIERELFEKKGRQSWTGERALLFATRAFVGITLPSLALYWLNGEDDDYAALPEETKNLFWAVKWWGSPALPAGGPEGFAGPVYRSRDAVFLLIPKPFEVGALFGTLPERLWQSIRENNPKALVDAALFTIVNTFHVDPVPQLAKPAVDVFYRNRYWTGAPIVPQSLQDVEPAEQYRPWTAKSMVEIGERFNVSPLKLEALVNGYLGTMGQYSLMAADALISADGSTGPDPEKRLSMYPVFRRFLREQPFTRTAYEARFYELADEVTVTVNTMAKMRREARADKIERYLGETEKRQLLAMQTTTAKATAKSRDIDAAMRAVRNSPFLSADQKRQQMDRLQAEQNDLFRDAVKALDVQTLERYRKALEGTP